MWKYVSYLARFMLGSSTDASLELELDYATKTIHQSVF